MKKLLTIFFIGILVCFTVNSAKAITVSGNPPTSPTNPGLNVFINTAFQNALNDANNQLQKYDDQPDLAKGFANANAYAAHAATLQGYQDYDLFAVMVGIMAGAQLPSSNKSYYDDLDKKVEEKGDLYIGASAALALNVGINAGFIFPGLYLNVKGGYFSKNDIKDKLSVENILLGVGANYTWLQTKSFLAGLFMWRGISFGTGFIFNKSDVKLNIELDTIAQDIPTGTSGVDQVYLDPSIKLGVKSTAYIIPLDVTTSVRLLWFLNFNLGAGVDFVFGYTDIIVKANGSVTGHYGTETITPGSFYVDASTKDKHPSLIRPKIMSGLGLNISVVKIDVPVIIYPTDNAFAVGLSAGVVW